MTNHLSRFERLPNELLIDIFQYLQSDNLFQAFYSLNFRLNILLQTLPFLSLTLSTNHCQEDLFFPYIRALIINRGIDLNFNHFSQIRFLILRFPTEKSLDQLHHQFLPSLEHLRINHIHISLLHRIPHLTQKIFSNIFPQLISCYLVQWGTIATIQDWTYSSLRILKVGSIDRLIYKTILSISPNLFYLQFATVTPNHTELNIIPHQNLKRMIIKTTASIPAWDDEEIHICFSYVPRLEYLRVHRTDRRMKSKSNWLASIIACSLPFLCQFDYYFHIDHFAIYLTSDIENMKEEFQIAHGNHYQSRLIVH